MALRDARALIFDLDGTLVDSLEDIALHLNAMLVARGLAPRSRTEIAEWVGYGAEQLVVRAMPHPEQVAEALAELRAYYRARPVVHTRVYAGLASVLDAIAAGRKLAVLSNKPHDLTVAVVDALLARWPFAVVAGQRAGRPHKPDPAALLDVAAELAIEPSACVMIGDSEVDVATARAAGVPSIAVSWGLRPQQILVAAGPDHLVHAPAELGALFA
ncbi:MAG TPA: HAD-IA family hydrolase [Kofleriaceae bacterium]|jgi:phosphoglycolate phosphatase|nr:HAD-IA family hydrolase [Kofleriaceae bacterium]